MLVLLACCLAEPLLAGRVVRVGIYQNPPKIFTDEQQQASGFFPDVIRAIAEVEGWQLQFVPCVWHVCLDMLERGELDIMPDVAHSLAREKRFTFGHEVVLSSWSEVYRRSGVTANSILALNGKKVALLANSIQYAILREQVVQFDVHPEYVLVDSFDEAFRRLQRGEVDYVLVNRFFGALHGSRYGAEPTNIMLHPSALKFAFPQQAAPELRLITDQYVREFKQHQDSPYYQSMQRWLDPLAEKRMPDWIRWTLQTGGVVLLVLTLLVLVLRHMVKSRTAQLELEREHYYHLSMHDQLTGLPNRLLFVEQLEKVLKKAPAAASSYVFFIDLDQFKHINDAVGHAVGDRVLELVSRRLEEAAADMGLLARLGGDEFAVLCESCEDDESAAKAAGRLLAVLDAPFVEAGQPFYLSASVGISVHPADGSTAEALMKHADAALFHAKDLGRNTYAFYGMGMSDQAQLRISLEADLRGALRKGQFVVHYQPQLDLATRQIIGVEALLRWAHPQRGMIPPGDFIPLAEETGLIVELGEWVLHSACSQVAAWQAEGMPPMRLAINVSPVQVLRDDFYQRITSVVQSTGCDPANIDLELTETAILNYSDENLAMLGRLLELGFGVAIDDFGTGHSSLSRLKHLPATKLKIDIAFVRGLPGDRDDAAITRAIIALGEGLGLRVLAEGIEDTAQQAFLQAAGCHEGQGFLYSRPLPAEEMDQLLARGVGGQAG